MNALCDRQNIKIVIKQTYIDIESQARRDGSSSIHLTRVCRSFQRDISAEMLINRPQLNRRLSVIARIEIL